MREFLLSWSGYHRVQSIARLLPHPNEILFLENLARAFRVSTEVDSSQSEIVTAQLLAGPTSSSAMRSTVFVCTHHTGALDLVAAYPVLAKMAPRLKVVANKQLMNFTPLSRVFIGVHPVSARVRNTDAKAEMSQHLERDGNLMIFPAGKVGMRKSGNIVDFPWRHGLGDVLKSAKTVVPVFIDARNSRFFYFVRRFFPKLSLLFLLRSFTKSRSHHARVVIGTPIEMFELKHMSNLDLVQKLRERTYSLSGTEEIS